MKDYRDKANSIEYIYKKEKEDKINEKDRKLEQFM